MNEGSRWLVFLCVLGGFARDFLALTAVSETGYLSQYSLHEPAGKMLRRGSSQGWLMLFTKFLSRKSRAPSLPEFAELSFAPEGEDRILARIFSGKKTGFYVDIGAHHPLRFSTTYAFYLRGWRGLNVEPLPGSQALFAQHRPRDINLELAVGQRESQRTYFTFADASLNTFCPVLAEQYRRAGNDLVAEIPLATWPLAEILNRHVFPQQTIDFLNVDLESLGLEVLESNDWSRYRPAVILIEDPVRSLDQTEQSPACQLLREQGYQAAAKTFHTWIFARADR
jgi:FkbM family methyltransferase